MSGSILTLFGEEVVPEEQKTASKTKGRKKSAKEEATEDPMPAEPEATAEPVVTPAPIITDLFGQPIITEPVLAITASEPTPATANPAAPAKRTRKKASEETIIDPTVFAEASLFDLFSGPQELSKIAADIQQHATPFQETTLDMFATIPESIPVVSVAEAPIVVTIPERVVVVTAPEIVAAIPETAPVEEKEETPVVVIEAMHEVVAPEVVVATPELSAEVIAEAPFAEPIHEPAQEATIPELVAATTALSVAEAISEMPIAEAIPEPTLEITIPELVATTPELPPVNVIAEIPVAETISEPAPFEPEMQVTAEVIEVVAEANEEIIVASEEPGIAEIAVTAVHSETPDFEIPAETPVVISADIQAEIVATPEAAAPIVEGIIVSPVEEVKAAVVAAEPEMMVAPIEEAIVARIEVMPADVVTPEPVIEVVKMPVQPVMEMVAVAPLSEVVVTKKKRTKKVVESAETEPETGDPAVSNNLPMDWQGHKTYYTIGEVAALFKVKTSNIRFWTNEFKLKVRTTRKGDRLYTPELVKEVRTIYHLVKERGFTLAGAKARLKTQNRKDVETVDLKHSLQQLRSQLVAIKNQLQ